MKRTDNVFVVVIAKSIYIQTQVDTFIWDWHREFDKPQSHLYIAHKYVTEWIKSATERYKLGNVLSDSKYLL